MLGIFLAGDVAIPIDPQLSPEDISDNLNRSDADILFYDERFEKIIPFIQSRSPAISEYVCLGTTEERISLSDIIAEETPDIPATVESGQCACILYTSGTTGKSKGVMLSHANLLDNATCCENECGVGNEGDVLLSVLPIHHAYCLTCDLLLAIRYGATLCINDSPMRLLQNIKLFQPYSLLLVPMIVETLYQRVKAFMRSSPDMSMEDIKKAVFGNGLKIIYCGGAYLSPDLIKAYAEMRIPIVQGYGMTECSPRITSSSLADPSTSDDVGRVVKNCSVRIVDGEIQAKSPSVMMGYYNNEEATREVFTEDGWLRTGDLGYLKDERVYITGRRKNLIILGSGENVSPEELENRFGGSDWLAEIMVYAEDGKITAEAYPKQEYYGKAEELFREQVRVINRSLPSPKRIIRLRLRENEFEKTTSRKIKRIQTGERGRLLS